MVLPSAVGPAKAPAPPGPRVPGCGLKGAGATAGSAARPGRPASQEYAPAGRLFGEGCGAEKRHTLLHRVAFAGGAGFWRPVPGGDAAFSILREPRRGFPRDTGRGGTINIYLRQGGQEMTPSSLPSIFLPSPGLGPPRPWPAPHAASPHGRRDCEAALCL